MKKLFQYIDMLADEHHLSLEQWEELIQGQNEELMEYAAKRANAIREEIYGRAIYVRGLIEFTNHCKNNCLYCGIRRDNTCASRYRLQDEEILECCRRGYELGFRTFVLQGGEDAYYSDEKMEVLVSNIKKEFPQCAITLSIGERSKESYKRLFDAGAERFLLRHETADRNHYEALHPKEMSFENRRECLYNLKEIGYQVGCGFMVGSPGQTAKSLAKDMKFIEELSPQMVGIGPFVPHHETPFRNQQRGAVGQTLYLLSLLRLLKPDLLIPATTSLGTIDPLGREKGIQAGANVVMPNLSPTTVRKKYELYDNKICTGDEAAECKECLNKRMKSIGYEIVVDRGDPPSVK